MATATQCRHDNPLRCVWREDVMRRNHEALHFSLELRAWVLWVADVPLVLTVCPGCGGQLPTMGAIERGLLRNDEGEE